MQALSTDVEIEVKCHKNFSYRVIFHFQIALLSIWPLNPDICIQTKGAPELQTYFEDNLCWTYGWDQKIVGLQPLTTTVKPKMDR